MKAKIKATGEIIYVNPTFNQKDFSDEEGYYTDGKLSLYTAENLDFLPEKETVELEGYVARDEDGFISIYQNKPTRDEYDCCGFWHDDDSESHIELPITSFPSVTWQSEPQRVRITLEAIDE